MHPCHILHDSTCVTSSFTSSPITLLLSFAVTTIILGSLSLTTGLGIDNTYADTPSTINITFTNPNPTIDLNVTSAAGSFAKSSDMGITVSSTNFSGFTLTIKGDDASGRLKGKNVENNYLSTIPTSITEDTYSNEANTTYNSTWAFKPSKYNSIDNTGSNSYFYPGPTTTATTIDNITNNNNTGAATTSNYTISIGARANMETIKDSYQGTFTITATPNAPAYTLNYNSATGTPENMPTLETGYINQTTKQITIANTTPTRTDGYEFKGWCTVTTNNETCSGTTIPANGTYTFTNINYTTINNLTLYAIWKVPIRNVGYMQDIDDWRDTLTLEEQVIAVDKRDNKEYFVSLLKDGNIWMTQNLDFEITGETLTSETTDLTAYGTGTGYESGAGYTQENGVIKWDPTAGDTSTTAITSGHTVPVSTTTGTIPGLANWVNDYYAPYSAEGGDVYVYTSNSTSADTVYISLADCVSASHTETECKHYHRGNYYNWSAVVASNNTNVVELTTEYNVAGNSICPAGWRLPVGQSSATQSAATMEFGNLMYTSGINISISGTSYTTDGFNNLRKKPLFFVRGGYIRNTSIYGSGTAGNYWPNSIIDDTYAHYSAFNGSNVYPANSAYRFTGFSVRCVARKPEPKCPSGNICYNGNGADEGFGGMADQTASANTTVTLRAPNYKRTGYGFLGWSEKKSPTIGTDTIYGPMEDITTPSTLSTEGMKLYAIWLPKSTEYTMQTFTDNICKTKLTPIVYNNTDNSTNTNMTFTLSSNSFLALEDERDGNVYTIARMPNTTGLENNDGNCWMLENLRLGDDVSAEAMLAGSQTYNGAFGGSFTKLPPSDSSSTTWNGATSTNGNFYTSVSGITQYTMPRYMDDNINPSKNTTASTGFNNTYAYGNYYTWNAARGTTEALDSGNTTTSICPTNWRLPLGNSTNNYSFGKLSVSLGGTSATMSSSTSPTSAVMSARLRHFPNNVLYSGYRNTTSVRSRGAYGYYWSSTAGSSNIVYYLYLNSTYVLPGTNILDKYYGSSVRCLVGY